MHLLVSALYYDHLQWSFVSGFIDDFGEYTISQRSCLNEKSSLIALPPPPLAPAASWPSVDGASTHLLKKQYALGVVGQGVCEPELFGKYARVTLLIG